MGGIAGALLVALLIVYVLRGRHRHQRRWSDRRVDVLDEYMGGTEYPKGATRSNELVERYQPTPLALNGERDGYSLAPDGGSAGGYVPLETVYDSSAGDSSSGQGGGKRRASTHLTVRQETSKRLLSASWPLAALNCTDRQSSSSYSGRPDTTKTPISRVSNDVVSWSFLFVNHF